MENKHKELIEKLQLHIEVLADMQADLEKFTGSYLEPTILGAIELCEADIEKAKQQLKDNYDKNFK